MFPGGILAGTNYEYEQRRKLTYRILPTSEWTKAYGRKRSCKMPSFLATQNGDYHWGVCDGRMVRVRRVLVVTYRRMRTCDNNLLEGLRRSDPSSSFALWLDRLS
jgi:hypothetical protein